MPCSGPCDLCLHPSCQLKQQQCATICTTGPEPAREIQHPQLLSICTSPNLVLLKLFCTPGFAREARSSSEVALRKQKSSVARSYTLTGWQEGQSSCAGPLLSSQSTDKLAASQHSGGDNRALSSTLRRGLEAQKLLQRPHAAVPLTSGFSLACFGHFGGDSNSLTQSGQSVSSQQGSKALRCQ